MNRKKILMLGGSFFQVPAIQFAKTAGYHVVTCDYLPENPGHQYADEYFNVSTTDHEAVLALARALNIDGIVAYASDPAAPTAAYVSEQIGLPGNPYTAVLTLARKDLFRKFLEANGFATPRSYSFRDLNQARRSLKDFGFPVIIKPVDSSGSKGVSVLYQEDQLPKAFDRALGFSREKMVIIEQFVEKAGYQVAGDGFIVNGKLAFRLFANEHFNENANALVPIGESFPSVLDPVKQQRIHEEIQRALNILGMRMGALNFDIRVGLDGKIYLMEIGPRNGGNLIPQATHYATGVDMVKYSVNAALGLPCDDLKLTDPNGCIATYVIHSRTDGVFSRIEFSKWIKNKIRESEVWVKPGDQVKKFDGSNCTLGTLILEFESQAQMLENMAKMDRHVHVSVQSAAYR